MELRIALAGNPNAGKTTLFNALTGSNQFVGNWPGVIVEKKEGKLKKHSDVIITDLPGIYSLSPYTLEEVVARNYLIEALMKEKTIIMIAHRLKTVEHADQIVVIDGGKIVQQGKHSELMSSEGIYRSFVESRKLAASWKI